MPAQVPDSSELMSHAAFVRGLARALVGDDDRAEDVLQETMLATLRRPPGDPSRMRGWLAAVTRRISLSVRRGERRRREREAVAARDEAQPSVAETVSGLEMQRHIVDSLQALDEPFRTTLYKRYFLAMGPTRIADEEGISVRTVESRLRRGLAQMRADLDRRLGGRSAWSLAALALVGRRKAVRWGPLGVKAALLAVVVAAGGVVFVADAGRRSDVARSSSADALATHAIADEAPPPAPESVTPPVSAVDAAWTELLARLANANPPQLEALNLARDVASFLRENPRYRDDALAEILARDRTDWKGAAVLAAACGQVPDEKLAVALAKAVRGLANDELRCYVISALGANRHAQPQMVLGYGEMDRMSGIGTAILEPEVRGELLDLARAEPEDDDVLRCLLGVLKFSQDIDPAIAAFLDQRARDAGTDGLDRALDPLRVSRRPEVIEGFRRRLRADDPSPGIAAVAFALMRTGDPRDQLSLFDCLDGGRLSERARALLLLRLLMTPYVTSDARVMDRLTDHVLAAAADSRSPAQSVALSSVLSLHRWPRGDEIVDAVRRVAEDPAQPVTSRVWATTDLGKTELPALEPWLWKVASDEGAPSAVRACAVRYWARYATPATRDAFRQPLEKMLKGRPGSELSEALREAIARLGG